MEGFQVVMNFVLMPILFLSGAFFPLQELPGWLGVLTHLDPAAYAVDAIRRVVLAVACSSRPGDRSGTRPDPVRSAGPVAVEALILVACSLVALTLAVRWFSQQE